MVQESPLPIRVLTSSIVTIPVNGSRARIGLPISTHFNARRIFQDEAFDIVHLHEPIVSTITSAVLQHSQGVNVGTFYACGARSLTLQLGGLLFGHLGQLHGRITISKASYDFINSHFPADYRIIPSGIDFDRFARTDISSISQFCDQKVNILFVGRLDQRKGFDYLLKAFQRIKGQVHAVRLVVVGAFDTRDAAPYQDYARRNRIGDVEFIGCVTDDELPRWYHTAHIFCAPSLGGESFGIVLLEAMAAGLPIVSSDIEGYRCLVTNGVEGELIRPADTQMLADTLIGMIHDPRRRRAYGQAGQVTAVKYSSEHIAAKVLDYYYELIAHHRRHSYPASSSPADRRTPR
jgi:phosphatidylinositol alpha-mannosyltransferase